MMVIAGGERWTIKVAKITDASMRTFCVLEPACEILRATLIIPEKIKKNSIFSIKL